MSEQRTSDLGVVHYGPVWQPRTAPGESLAACRPGDEPGTLTTVEDWVTCPECKRYLDPTPWCSYGHRTQAECDCGPIAENN